MLERIIAATLVLAATPLAAQDCDAGMRLFEHHAGKTCIPESPQRIVAARGDAIATPLLELGAPIIGTGFREMEDGTPYVRGASDIFGDAFVEAAELANIGSPNNPDLEAIAALKPDLIIIRTYEEEALAQYQAIAPTVMITPYLPFLDHIAWLADVAGIKGSYDNQLAEYEARIAEARQNIGKPEEITISRLDIWEDGLWYYPNWGAVAQVIDDIGFDRPAFQAEATENLNGLSFELLPEFDGDIIISSAAPRFGQSIQMLTELHDEVAPFWRQLPGVAAGNHYFYERDIWNGRSFKSLHASIDGLELLTAGRNFD